VIVRFEEYDATPLETLTCEARSADTRGAWFSIDPDSALFVPWNADWCVRFYAGDAGGLEVFAQAVKPVRISGQLIEFIALDLGVEVEDGGVRLTGEDEFEWNQVAQDYPEELIARAQRAVNEAFERVMLAEYPFDRSAAEIVAELRNVQDTSTE
jgi:protein associated with RNAse G/E